ncbi:TIGR01244 family sulfur transferase [Marinicella sp. S1101]|uniref:bifunctional protein tyrosine phosphatase family protein/NAD(P)/FAD-dependent oxidoreductase n=1 Tax=Marinicella marina TaxID=2996016 RepID=UPI002260D12B|nr:bifunctional protein tyrosine phosphatase family protein/NAD(P)/FAD-dependent oxidoreductase [Marinicella marina]MCX7554189.1 TIGR01244 family sulfur transferase [Marinicella marina]MDJ1141118.1 TIGR01244 family sulfur transferase [Marinicella marina]
MKLNHITEQVSASPQISSSDITAIQAAGFKSIICNRPDGEDSDQPNHSEISAAAKALGIDFIYQPINNTGSITTEDIEQFEHYTNSLPGPVLAYCRTGTRSTTLWSLSQAKHKSIPEIIELTKAAGYDMSGVVRRIANGGEIPLDTPDLVCQVAIVGAGAAGIAVASSLAKRHTELDIIIIDPADIHYYQPGWTMVGGGIFSQEQTVKTMASLIPPGIKWLKEAVAAFEPENNSLILSGCKVVKYEHLIVCPGLKLDWESIEGLTNTLGKNGVTSNYRFDLAPYTWDLVKSLKSGKAIFTQPPMPIKCAGAPQKAMYLSSDYWYRNHLINDIDVEFYNAGPVLFGVDSYVPALMKYVDRYQAALNFSHNLVKVDGEAQTAWFTNPQGEVVEKQFDMLHVCPPQTAPDFIKSSPLVDENGWIDVDQSTLRHKKYHNIYSLGDVMNAPNAKTAAAARKQAPVVANNLLSDMGLNNRRAIYDGYGSCPLTVEKGKIVLAEFGYGGKLLPSFPKFIVDGTKPSRISWFLKEKLLPPIYWKAMLKGREWLAQPQMSKTVKTKFDQK